jgi:hypothetical protein
VPEPAASGGGRGAPRALYNWTSIVGLVLAVGGATGAVFLSLADALLGTQRTYPGVLLLPFAVPVVLGLVLVLVGVLRERRRRARGFGPSITPSISIDLAKLTRRRPLFFIVTGTMAASLVVFGLGFGTLSVVEYSESNAFCGQVCHSVMNPEYQAFHASPHSRLDCVDCHVAPGAEGFLFAKLNGLSQLVSIATGSYERPIPTPVHQMRSARELCETCHTPERLIGHVSLGRQYFLADAENTPYDLQMLVHVGGQSRMERGAGIHYHMFLGRKVEYKARDEQRQQIAWVKLTRPDGSTLEYENESDPLSEEERAALPVRTMDCLDCHNRPAHRFAAPTDAVNEALATGVLPRKLPYIKRQAVIALDGDYESAEEAAAGIEESLQTFYEEEEPEVVEGQEKELRTAIRAVQNLYRANIFPEMKVDWSAYPDNIGHRDWPGCFRCHNEDMVSEEGSPVFEDCDGCHRILWQGDGDEPAMSAPGEAQPFLHPEDGEAMEEFSDCTECHTGGAELYE